MSRLFRILAVSIAAAFWLAGPLAAEPAKLVILHLNDWDRIDAVDGAGGAGRIAAVIKDEKAKAAATGATVIVTFGGDMISPSLLSGIDKGAAMIDLANTVGLDYATLGNHEFDFGPEVLKARIAESRFRWLAGNVALNGRAGFPGAVDAAVVEVGGFKIGFLGLTTPDTPLVSSPGPDVTFEAYASAGARIAKALKDQGADMVIALSHEEYTGDLALMQAVPAIDLVLGGHDHLALTHYDGQHAVFKAGSQGTFVGRLALTIDRVEGRGGPKVVWKPDFAQVHTFNVTPDPAVQAKVDAYLAKLDTDLGQPIGTTTTELDSRRATVRNGEATIGNLFADAMRSAVSADVAIINGGGIRGDVTYPAGSQLTRKMVFTELPFGNRTAKLQMTGADILAALENGVSQVEQGAGRFPQVSGLRFAYAVGKAAGSRVSDVTIGGKPLDPAATYTVATNDFMARGGDGYATFATAKTLIDDRAAKLMASQIMDHIVAAGTVSPTLEGRSRRLD
ncbi:bifunctional UDP-sugar hydrolase/5'-nucleotidase [Thalassobaculum sp.]|uniref:bifunctional metallophosphatase/5'-nucleotidase n=1 Tax=Thalassobaculum sp. TaxID=2022740 RepID=UPI0032ECFF6D